MHLVGRLPAPLQSEQEQQAIARVHERMHPFGYHRRTAGYCRHTEFRYGNRQIAGDGGVDRYSTIRQSLGPSSVNLFSQNDAETCAIAMPALILKVKSDDDLRLFL